MNLPMSSLIKTALGIGVAGTCTMYMMRWLLQEHVINSPSYSEAMQIFRNNEKAKNLLGEPIAVKRVDVGDKNCYGRKDDTLWIGVPLMGKNHKGHLYYWVKVGDPVENTCQLIKAELEVEGCAENRITLKNDSMAVS